MKIKIFSLFVGIALVIVAISTFLFFKSNVKSYDSLFTKQEGCTPYNLLLEKGDDNFSVRIKWMTKEKCSGFVQYGLDREDLNRIGLNIENVAKSTEHEVLLEKLLAKERYFFIINSDNKGYARDGSPLEFLLEDL
ncbi:fibronectin type III domain-containing protein [Candidatus Dojkabacteria bacterium]|jgi:hypothetical protein|nr:fibronectin type III domain-containing protein [Candidatus Dojkabacteria bacterium]